MSSLLRNKISSDIQDLNELHTKYWWIPNENMIRPTQKMIEDKRQVSESILYNWMSFKDFILHNIFNCPYDTEDGHLYVPDSVINYEWHFSKSIFPYDVPSGVNHYVLWNSQFDYFKQFDDSVINTIITDTLESMVSPNDFDFAWYKNPKPSIPELYHVQVFWVKL